jgi:ankyrin repeat protein
MNELMKALRGGNPRQATRFVAEGADLRCKDKAGDTPLHVACISGYFALALQMLDRGADALATNKERATPLAQLAMAGASKARAPLSVSVAAVLLRQGASVDARDREGITPLMWAVNRGNLPLIQFLIDAGADVNARDRQQGSKNTVVMYAQRLDVVELLLRRGADPAVRNGSGETAWEYALLNDHIRGYRKQAELLRSHGERQPAGRRSAPRRDQGQ